MHAGKTIQIFSPSGDPRGVRIAEITTRIVQAVVVPRARLEEAAHRAELCGVGMHYLFGESDAGGFTKTIHRNGRFRYGGICMGRRRS